MPGIAALYDIHGNFPALEAVLSHARGVGVERVVVGGDVLPGPMPVECLAALGTLDVPAYYILGNGDRAVVQQMAGTPLPSLPAAAQAVIRWTADQLDDRHRRGIETWLPHVTLPTALGDVFFCHATARNDTEIFTAVTPADAVARGFETVEASIAVCGHTHMQFDRRVGPLRIVNAGSVGMPYGEPGAYWLLVTDRVELQHTPYDLAAASARLRTSSYPDIESFITNDLMNPKPESEMMTLFERHAIG